MGKKEYAVNRRDSIHVTVDGAELDPGSPEWMCALVRDQSDRFWDKVEFLDSTLCWEWRSSKDTDGYGRFWLPMPSGWHAKWMNMTAHRVCWMMVNGPIRDGLVVMHFCDRRICVNPFHLSLGTARENKIDEVMKGRHARGEKLANRRVRVGEAASRSSITEKTALDILRCIKDGKRNCEIMRLLGVSNSAVMGLRSGKSWRHLRAMDFECVELTTRRTISAKASSRGDVTELLFK